MKITRRTKLLIIALVLCMTTMIGSTLAWFTDTVESGINTIESGNLDIELAFWDGDSYEAVTNTTKLFKENILWEPGHTEVAYLKITNAGNLALKYVLDVNVADEKTGTNVAGETFKLSDYLTAKVVEGKNAAEGDYNRADAVAATAGIIGQEHQMTTKGDVDYVALVVYMPTTVGNEANPKTGTPAPTVTLGVKLNATQLMYESDSFGPDYDKNAMIVVKTAAEAQAALDAATPGAVIKLAPGENYGTLVFRQTAASKVVDITTAGGDAAGNEKYRKIENLTIIGTEGAVVDGFDFQVSWIAGSGASYIDITNMTVKGVTFSGKATPFNFEGSKGSALGIDGLMIADCKMNDADSNNRFVFQQISGYKTLNDKTANKYVMTAGIKNLTITGCEIVGAYQVIESRAMENLTITNNTFKGVKARDMLITSDTTNNPNVTYTGKITITGNKSIGGEERFIRASLNNSDAEVVIKDNTIVNYMGADSDYIKVDGGKNVTMENNIKVVVLEPVSTADELLAALAAGKSVELKNDINCTAGIVIPEKGIINGNGKTITYTGTDDDYHLVKLNTGAELKNVTLNNYRVRTESTTDGDVTLENVVINMDNDQTGLDISRGAGTANLTNVVCKGTKDAAHLNPNTQVQVDYTPYGDVLLGTKWAMKATNCDFGSLHGWNTTNGSNVSLNNTTCTVFRMHYWSNRTLYVNGVETAWAESGAIPVAHDVGGCWSVQPAFK